VTQQMVVNSESIIQVLKHTHVLCGFHHFFQFLLVMFDEELLAGFDGPYSKVTSSIRLESFSLTSK